MVIMFMCVTVIAGCTTSPSSTPNYSYTNHFDHEFEKGANRRPIPETLYGVARILISQGRYADADAILSRSIVEHPLFVPAYAELAELHMRSGRIGTAMETLAKGLNVSPENPMLLNNMGMCWLVRGEYEMALACFTDAASLDPDDMRYRANMATALGMVGRYSESLALYEQIVSEDIAHYNLAIISMSRNDHERAAQAVEVVKAIDPTLVNGLHADLGNVSSDPAP